MKWLLISVTIFLILVTAAGLFAFIYANAHNYNFFPGVMINQQSLKNLSHAQASQLWQSRVDEFIKQGLKYQFNKEKIVISPTAANPDVAYQLINFDVAGTVDEAYFYGRKKGYSRNFLAQLKALLWQHNIPLKFQLNQENFANVIVENFSKFTTPKMEAVPMVDDEFNIVIQDEAAGTTFDYQQIMAASLSNIQNLSGATIDLNLEIDQPQIKKAEVPKSVIDQLSDILDTSTLTLNYGNKEWKIANSIFKDWFALKKLDDEIILGLEASITKAYLDKNIAPEIYRPTLDAKFDVNNGRVTEFQGSQDGRALDLDKSFEKIEHDLLKNNIFSIELTVKETKAKVSTESVNDLGITEILGTGSSNFKGSPQNRRHNIAVGGASLNGLLIKPGETFSLIKALGEINKEAGYLPELVIKGDATIPEYGGGLCQIGTTVFRTTLASGLPVIERRNHSYRVVYYEPAGTDATIYNPWPDYQFKNDTANHILIQTRIEGDNLYFDFWGTADGRKAEQTQSTIYNITSPGETIYIETDKLEPGVKKCTESAHAGADAYFDYTVTYADGSVTEKRFNSHYIPWPARCLIGKDPSAATTTADIIESQ